jgi:hypothetical protein
MEQSSSAFCCSATRFLLSLGSLIFLMTTICLVKQVWASVLMLRLLLMADGLHCLGRNLQMISVNVDPRLKSIFSNCFDLTEDIVSTIMILVRVMRLLLGILIIGSTMVSVGCLSSTWVSIKTDDEADIVPVVVAVNTVFA